jgi:hypothetical protein
VFRSKVVRAGFDFAQVDGAAGFIQQPKISRGQAPPSRTAWGATLDIRVVFTRPSQTKAALAVAGQLARDLNARLTLLATQVVPYPLPLDRPQEAVDFIQRTMRALACRQDVETAVEVYVCRDPLEAIRQILPPESVVVLGTGSKWRWPSPERKLARVLRRDGHHVITAIRDSRQIAGEPAPADPCQDHHQELVGRGAE